MVIHFLLFPFKNGKSFPCLFIITYACQLRDMQHNSTQHTHQPGAPHLWIFSASPRRHRTAGSEESRFRERSAFAMTNAPENFESYILPDGVER